MDIGFEGLVGMVKVKVDVETFQIDHFDLLANSGH